MVTIGTQVYRSIQNYELNKERFINEMQQSLDVSLEAYFADLTRKQLNFTLSPLSDSTQSNVIVRGAWTSSISGHTKKGNFDYLELKDSLNEGNAHFYTQNASANLIDSAFRSMNPSMLESISVSEVIGVSDSLIHFPRFAREVGGVKDSLDRLKGFAQKIIFSLTRDELDLDSLRPYLKSELERRNIEVDHVLVLYRWRIGPVKVEVEDNGTRTVSYRERQDTIYSKVNFAAQDYPLKVESSGTFLAKNQRLSLRFENASLSILKRGGVDLMVSLLISAMVVGALLYLYRIITEQKQLAEIKNDLISNITHEFKTPIATISTAMEGISNFNQANDVAKTNKYLGISKDQLKKLNGMVEKLLETASLDSNELEISKEEVEAVGLTRQLFERFNVIKGEKQLSLKTELVEEWVMMDAFHMENAIGNLIDNAIKYGGEQVFIRLIRNGKILRWEVEDNGGKINKLEQQRIFDKFYRIPTGNVHNVKGFGIGLYYTKSLVEKHGGKIDLEVSQNSTLFSIEITDDKA